MSLVQDQLGRCSGWQACSHSLELLLRHHAFRRTHLPCLTHELPPPKPIVSPALLSRTNAHARIDPLLQHGAANLVASIASGVEVYANAGSVGGGRLEVGTVLRYSLLHQMQAASLQGGGGVWVGAANAGKTVFFYFEKSLLLERNFCWPLESLENLESNVCFVVSDLISRMHRRGWGSGFRT